MLAGACIVLAALGTYHNSFSGPFVFDDKSAITENSTLRSLWPLWPVITPMAGGGTVCGRPVLNLTFALNHAIGGTSVWGYHAANLAIHAASGLALFGFLRRTFQMPALPPRFQSAALPLAWAISLIWVVHPLHTAAVTYVVQRAESLAGLFYLATLWSFARGLESPDRRGWLWASAGFCALGMGTKETMFSAPLAVLLYDRTFVSGSFREAWRRSGKVYLAFVATWSVLGYCVLATGNRGGTAGLTVGFSNWAYLQTQFCAILEYLRLALWPSPLVFDYGIQFVTDPRQWMLPGLFILTLGGIAAAGIVRRAWWGFFGFWFFALLAPSSSFVVVATQTMALHRMYLPLAAFLTILVGAGFLRFGRLIFLPCALGVVLFATLTIRRNTDFRSELGLWADTVVKCPGNARALENLGGLLLTEQRFSEAVTFLEESIIIAPDNPKALNNLGIALTKLNRPAEAVPHFREALARDPAGGDRQVNLAIALIAAGETKEGRDLLKAVLHAEPSNPRALQAIKGLEGEP